MKSIKIITSILFLVLTHQINAQQCTSVSSMCSECYSGQKAFETGKYTDAEKIWKSLADKEHLAAQHWLGYYYVTIKKDSEKGKYWYEKAANQNFVHSQYQLGELYGAEQDFKSSLNWFEKSAKNGFAMGQLMTGYFYSMGKDLGMDTEKDKDKAIYWLTIAVEQGMSSQDEIDAGNDSKLGKEAFQMAKQLLTKLESE